MRPLISLLILKAPYRFAADHYRPYEDRLNRNTVINWVIGRFREALPHCPAIACLADEVSEVERLKAAYEGSETVEFLHLPALPELEQVLELSRRYKAEEVLVSGFDYAIMPDNFFAAARRVHGGLNADLTSATSEVLPDGFCIVRSPLLEDLNHFCRREERSSLLAAADLMQRTHLRHSGTTRGFHWLQIDALSLCRIERTRWPESVALRTRRDVQVLREALTEFGNEPRHKTIVDALKSAAVASRARPVSDRLSFPKRSTKFPRRVLYVSASRGFTGAHQSLCHLIGALDRRRYEPVALTPHTGTMTDELRRRGATVICPEADFAAPTTANIRFAHDVLRNVVPDLVHSNHSIGLPLVCMSTALGIPLVQHVRVQSPRTISELVCAANKAIAVSDFIRLRLCELDIDPSKVEVIRNGVATEEFCPDEASRLLFRQRFGIGENEFVVLTIARLAQSKRHEIAIDAVRQLRQKTGRGHLVLIGSIDGDRIYAHRVRSSLLRPDLARHVTALEFLSDVRPALHGCDVMILPSRDEPLSRAVLEVMAVGRPVIVDVSGGNREVVVSGETGFVVDCQTSAVAEAINTLATDGQLARTMGIAAAASIRRSLTARHCAELTMNLYDRVLAHT